MSEADTTVSHMVDDDSRSYCSNCDSVEFYWEDYRDPQTAVDRAVDALEQAAYKGPYRVRDPYKRGTMRGQFRAILEYAEQGQLRPVDEVKRIRRPTWTTMYELRWPDIRVTEVKDGRKRFVDVEMRLLEVETSQRPCEALGLRAFEKKTEGSEAEIRHWQNQEIDGANAQYLALLRP